MQYPTREFSAKVDIQLEVNGELIRLSQMGREFVIVHDAPRIAPSPGTILLTVDGVIQRFPIYLAEGLTPGRSQHPILMLQPSWS